MNRRTSAWVATHAPAGTRWGTKTLSLLLSLVLCLTLLPGAAFATDDTGAAQMHTHCLCGAAHKTIFDHNTDTPTAFTAWDNSTSLPENSGSYYLTQDVALDKGWSPADGTVLCLNGHSITNTGTVSVIWVKAGSFTLTDCAETPGKITHAGTGNHIGVYVTDTITTPGSFTMFGGEISRNEAVTGGGVSVHGSYPNGTSTFTMYGGIITENRADQGGGVYLSGYSAFVLNGGTIAKNSGDGVYLDDGTFTRNGGEFEGNLEKYKGTVQDNTGKLCTVRFDLAGGSAPSAGAEAYQPQTVPWGATITDPAEPERPGWVFGGWYLDGNYFLGDRSCVTKDCTLTAKWTSKISVVSNGQEIVITSENYTDVLGDGTVSYTPPSVDFETYTQEDLNRVLRGEAAGSIQPAVLTLRNADLQCLAFYSADWDENSSDSAKILSRLLNCPWLKLEGENQITAISSSMSGLGIASSAGCLVVTGDGSLHIDAANCAVYCRSYLQRSGVVTIDSNRLGIYNEGESTIQFLGGELTFQAETAAVNQLSAFLTAEQTKLWAGDSEETATLIDPPEDGAALDTVISVVPKFLRLHSHHTVTFDPNNGDASASVGADYGTLLTEPAAPQKSGCTFDGWYRPDGTKWDFNADAVTGDITLTARWTRRSSSGSSSRPSYTVSVDKTEHGSVTVSPRYADRGDTVTITVTSDKGYTLETLTVTDKNGNALKLTEKNGKYTFTMPASKVTVKATFMDDNMMLNYFVDVKSSDYYYDAVLWAAQNGITSGTDAVHFSPNQPCTRAQIVTFLWRAAGSPMVNYAMNMTDVPADAYYAEAVRWALSEGITTGTTESTFSPDETCTRAQAVAFLFRYAAPEAVTLQELVSGFSDAASVPGYALSAMNWALAGGIVQGDGRNLMPNDSCTRAQIVTFLYRALEK